MPIGKCLPILSSIFVKWRWLFVILVGLTMTIAAMAYSAGKKIQSHDDRIINNRESLDRIETKIDTLMERSKRWGL